jgi:SAM-dependent methyltransferase
LRYGPIKRLLRQLKDVHDILEIGAGEGAMGTRLARRFNYVGLEPDARSFERAKVRVERVHGTALHGDVSVLDRSDFDLACAFEVLEHIKDDRSALRVWRERLRPGGWIVLSVPAHARRFDAADRKAGHFRRYDRRQLAETFASAGFSDVVIWSYGMPLGYLLEWGRNVLARRGEAASARSDSVAERTAASGRWYQPASGMGWVTAVVTAPFRLMQWPFLGTSIGTGFVARARRQS